MDTIMHGFVGYLFAFVFFSNVYIILLCILLGVLPDVIGYIEKIIKRNPTAWGWYSKIHYDWWWLWIIPPIGLHVLLDRFTHGEGKRWWIYKERLWLEVLLWLLLLLFFGVFIIG